MDSIDAYPLKGRRDVRSAMARAMAEFVARLRFTEPKEKEPFGFARVYADWASFNDRALSGDGPLPAAAVLPDRPVYEANGFVPSMIESTWSGGDPLLVDDRGRQLYPIGDGSGRGFALFTIAEMVVPFVLIFRARSKPQRSAIVRILETSMVEDGSVVPDPSTLNPILVTDEMERPIRYGRLLTMDDYYGRKVRISLQSQQLLDSESGAGENRWMAQFEIAAQAQVCVVRRILGMNPQFKLTVGGTTETCV